jgi:hypothetical protein
MPKKPKPPKKPMKKLTPAQKVEKRRRKAEFETIFVEEKQKRVRRRPLIEGLDPDEFIRRNADPIWLHQNGLWEEMERPLFSQDADASAADHKDRSENLIEADERSPF